MWWRWKEEREDGVCQCMWWRELEVVTIALPFSAWSLANPISTSDSAAVDDIGLVAWCGSRGALTTLTYLSIRERGFGSRRQSCNFDSPSPPATIMYSVTGTQIRYK